MSNKSPVFIVGVPRSGTTLLAAMLAANSNMSCGPETHFFRWIERVDVSELIDPQNWPGKAVDFIGSIVRRSYTDESPRPLVEKYGITSEEIRNYLHQQSPSIAAILSSITEIHMQHSYKNRWVEKTPDHIKHLFSIREAFPDACIIHIVRDPRDVALSLTKIPWGVQSFFEGLIYWKNLDDSAFEFFSRDTSYYRMRFEDLIESPQVELTRLCDFLGETFEVSMLDTSVTGKQLNSRQVPWKDKASQPIDPNRKMVWEKEISSMDNQLAEAYLGSSLDKYHYPRKVTLAKYGYLFPDGKLIKNYTEELKALASSGLRFWKIDAKESPDAYIFFGDPANKEWADFYPNSIFKNKRTLFQTVLLSRLRGQQLIWVNHNLPFRWTGLSAYLIKLILGSPTFFGEFDR